MSTDRSCRQARARSPMARATRRVCEGDHGDAKLERGDLVVALGGGVVGDLAGFRRRQREDAACVSSRCRPRSWRRWIPRSAARPRINSPARQEPRSAPSTSRALVLADTTLRSTTLPRTRVSRGLCGNAEIRADRRTRHSSPSGSNGRLRRSRSSRCGPARDRRDRPLPAAMKAGVVMPATRPSRASAPSSTSATPSAHALERLVDYDGTAPRARRGRRDRHLACAFRFSASNLASAVGPGCRAGRGALAQAVGLPTRIADVAGLRMRTPDAILDAMLPGQEGAARQR